jgi:hypothetical protein
MDVSTWIAPRQNVVVTIGGLVGSDGRGDMEVTVQHFPKNLGMLVLGIWLIVTGLLLVVTIPRLPLIESDE